MDKKPILMVTHERKGVHLLIKVISFKDKCIFYKNMNNNIIKKIDEYVTNNWE